MDLPRAVRQPSALSRPGSDCLAPARPARPRHGPQPPARTPAGDHRHAPARRRSLRGRSRLRGRDTRRMSRNRCGPVVARLPREALSVRALGPPPPRRSRVLPPRRARPRPRAPRGRRRGRAQREPPARAPGGRLRHEGVRQRGRVGKDPEHPALLRGRHVAVRGGGRLLTRARVVPPRRLRAAGGLAPASAPRPGGRGRPQSRRTPRRGSREPRVGGRPARPQRAPRRRPGLAPRSPARRGVVRIDSRCDRPPVGESSRPGGRPGRRGGARGRHGDRALRSRSGKPSGEERDRRPERDRRGQHRSARSGAPAPGILRCRPGTRRTLVGSAHRQRRRCGRLGDSPRPSCRRSYRTIASIGQSSGRSM